MNSPRFDRFSQPHYLQRIGRERVTQILLPLATELLPHGIALPATALPDDLFFQVLATLPRRAAECSLRLLEAMTAIEVINDLLPDERTPFVVSELRLRVRVKSRPVLLSPDRHQGVLDVEVCGGLESGRIEVVAEGETEAPAPLGGDVAQELSGLRRDVAAMRKAIRDLRHGQTSEPVSDNEAAQVFALMKSLDAGDRTRKAPLERVFRLLVLEGHSQDAVAVKCQCSAGLISLRVTEIERRMQRPLEQLRALATQLGSMDMPVDDSRARAIYRRGLTDDTGTEDEDE